VAGWDKTQINIERLPRSFGRPADRFNAAFFLASFGSGNKPACSKIRLTLLGLTNGTQLFALAISAAIRRLPHWQWTFFSSTTWP
jgi:hypothetical protein